MEQVKTDGEAAEIKTAAAKPEDQERDSLPQGGASGITHEAVAESTQNAISTTQPNVLETNIPMTSEPLSVYDTAPLPKTQNKNDVKFKVKYQKDFKGQKIMPEGSVQVISKESADKFTSLGIGSIIKNG